jgi:monovalent cation:H+ antiporter-2, CPA2 family
VNFVGILAMAGITFISSSGVIARLLNDLGRLGNRETPAVLSVLVLEDFAMAAYLPLLAVLAAGGTWWQALLWMGVALSRWARRSRRPTAGAITSLVGLTLTGETAARARAVLTPLRDLFAAVFFLAIGIAVDPADLVPMLPVAALLAAVTAVTKVATGLYAARRDGVGRPGQLRAGTALIARGEFSLVIIGLAGTSVAAIGSIATPYVFVLATIGPLLARFAR